MCLDATSQATADNEHERITWHFPPVTGRHAERKRQQKRREAHLSVPKHSSLSSCSESHCHGPNLPAAQHAKHRLRLQHSTANSCTFVHSSCSRRFTCCTLSFGDRCNRVTITEASAFLGAETRQLTWLISTWQMATAQRESTSNRASRHACTTSRTRTTTRTRTR